MKKEILKRMPPGDRWVEITGNNSIKERSSELIVGDTLTKALNFIYKKYNARVFEVDAGKGIVSIDDGKEEKVIDEDANSLYDEE